jgi:hypothetical protein
VPAGSEDDEHFEEKLEAWVNWTNQSGTSSGDRSN